MVLKAQTLHRNILVSALHMGDTERTACCHLFQHLVFMVIRDSDMDPEMDPDIWTD